MKSKEYKVKKLPTSALIHMIATEVALSATLELRGGEAHVLEQIALNNDMAPLFGSLVAEPVDIVAWRAQRESTRILAAQAGHELNRRIPIPDTWA